MIGFLSGKILHRSSTSLVIETGGVGYQIHVSGIVLSDCNHKNQLSLWIHTHFKNDILELYGFVTIEEKNLFLSLLKVNGVGPKMALTILGSCSLNEFIRFINDSNVKALTALPRVGKKTAQQIILALKDQASDVLLDEEAMGYSEKVMQALESLGFSQGEIKEALSKIKWKEDLEEDLKQALTYLNGV